jgi:hypothetical protein
VIGSVREQTSHRMNAVALNIGSGSRKVLLHSAIQSNGDGKLAKQPVREAKITTSTPDQAAGISLWH